MIDTNQTYLSEYDGKQVFQLQFEGVAEYLPCGICQEKGVTPCWEMFIRTFNSQSSDVALPLGEVLFMPLLV